MKLESMEFIFSFPVCFGFSLVAAHKQSKKKKKTLTHWYKYKCHSNVCGPLNNLRILPSPLVAIFAYVRYI